MLVSYQLVDNIVIVIDFVCSDSTISTQVAGGASTFSTSFQLLPQQTFSTFSTFILEYAPTVLTEQGVIERTSPRLEAGMVGIL